MVKTVSKTAFESGTAHNDFALTK